MHRNLIYGLYGCYGLRKWQEIPYSDIDYPIQKICMNCPIKPPPYDECRWLSHSIWPKLNYLRQKRYNKLAEASKRRFGENNWLAAMERGGDDICKPETLRQYLMSIQPGSTHNTNDPFLTKSYQPHVPFINNLGFDLQNQQTAENDVDNLMTKLFNDARRTNKNKGRALSNDYENLYQYFNLNGYLNNMPTDLQHINRFGAEGYIGGSPIGNGANKAYDKYGNPIYLKYKYSDHNGSWFQAHDKYGNPVGWYYKISNAKRKQMNNWIKTVYEFYNNVAGGNETPKDNQYKEWLKHKQRNGLEDMTQKTINPTLNSKTLGNDEMQHLEKADGEGKMKKNPHSMPFYEPFDPAKPWTYKDVQRPSHKTKKPQPLYSLPKQTVVHDSTGASPRNTQPKTGSTKVTLEPNRYKFKRK